MGLIAVLIFRPEIASWGEIIDLLWDPKDVEADPEAARVRMRQLARWVRKHLPGHEQVIAKGPTPGLLGSRPGRTDVPLRIDWDYFRYYQNAKQHRKALSLVRDIPLPGHREGDLRLGTLVSEIRKEVGQCICESLEELDVSIPADPLELYGSVLEEFAADRPREWAPELLAITPTPDTTPPELLVTSVTVPRIPHRPPPLHGAFQAGELFEPCPEGEKRLALELGEADKEGTHTWWSQGAWLGKFFAFWAKMNTRPCKEVALTLADDRYDAARFGLLGKDMPKDKATIIQAPSFYSDNPEKAIVCGVTNWGVAYEWAKSHGDEMLAHPSRPSVFGVVGRPVFPGIAGVHTLVQTCDGYVLFGLRAPDIAFHERTWSATFEEQVALGARAFTGPVGGDETVLHVIEGGLYEEWGIEPRTVTVSSCLAIGREWGRDRYLGAPMLNLSATIITACRLSISLAEVWASLDESAGIEDIDEHRAWAGIRFVSRADVLRFVAYAKGRKGNQNLLAEACTQPNINADLAFYPRAAKTGISDRGLMPTSAARLVLSSGWFETLER